MYSAITLFVSVCFAATAILYLSLYLKHKRRASDLWLAAIGAALGITYALYTFEDASPIIYKAEIVVDGAIGLILLWNLRKLVKFTFMEKPHGRHY